MTAAILVINAGSSSIKFAAYTGGGEAPELAVKGQLQGIGSDPSFVMKNAHGEIVDEHDEWPRGSTLDHAGAIDFILKRLREKQPEVEVVAAGHRVVHGGLAYDRPVRIDGSVLEALAKFIPLAPLHQPHNLAGILAVAAADPNLPQVA
jgi:acetate kinase